MSKMYAFCLLLLAAMLGGCNAIVDHELPQGSVTMYASGLVAPLGMEMDEKGQLWVTEAGDGKASNGRLSLITTSGEIIPVVTGFASEISPEGGVFGLNHILLQNGILWMLHGVEGKLYKLDVSTFKPGSSPLKASDLTFEDLGAFVKKHDFEHDTDASDLFSLTLGPGGDLFIVDAAANAIIRRNASSGELSIFATIPPIQTTAGDPAEIEPVPTGIAFDGEKFLVGCFSGYPFPANEAPIFQVDLNGKVSIFQSGFSSLADLDLDVDGKPVVVEYGNWTGEAFAENSGTFASAAGGKRMIRLGGLNFPNSIKTAGPHTYFVAQTFDGIIQKISL
jgi:hypothetical protein